MKRVIVFQMILMVATGFGLSACGYYHEVKGSAAQGVFRGSETLGFEVVKTIFQRNRCLDCHAVEKGNRGGINLETYANTKPLAQLVVDAVASGFMPMGGPAVPSGDQEVLKAWVDADAPEVSDLPLPGNAGAPETDEDNDNKDDDDDFRAAN